MRDEWNSDFERVSNQTSSSDDDYHQDIDVGGRHPDQDAADSDEYTDLEEDARIGLTSGPDKPSVSDADFDLVFEMMHHRLGLPNDLAEIPKRNKMQTEEGTMEERVPDTERDFVAKFIMKMLHVTRSTRAMAAAYDFFVTNAEQLIFLKGSTRSLNKFNTNLKKFYETDIPQIKLMVCLQERNQITVVEGGQEKEKVVLGKYKCFYDSKDYPVEMKDKAGYNIIFEVAYLPVKEALHLFQQISKRHRKYQSVFLHTDGITIQKSSGHKYDVYSFKFLKCHICLPVFAVKKHAGKILSVCPFNHYSPLHIFFFLLYRIITRYGDLPQQS